MTPASDSNTRSDLLDAAAELLNHAPGASMAEIAGAARVGRATLYRYFPSREDLLRALALAALEDVNTAAAPAVARAANATEMLTLVLEAIVPLGARYRFLRSVSWEDDPEIKASVERQLDELTALVEALKTEGAIAPDVPTAWATTTIDWLIWAAWEAVGDGTIAPKDAAGLVLRTVLGGLGSPASKS